MVATATQSNTTTTKKAAAAHQRDAMQERLRQIAGSPNAPGRAEADRVLADETPAEAAPAPSPEPAATVAEEPAEETPVVKRVKPKPAATVPTEKFSVLMTHDEVAALDKLKAHLKRQGVISRKMPDAWLIRLAVATWTSDGQDFAPLVAAMKEQDGRGKR